MGVLHSSGSMGHNHRFQNPLLAPKQLKLALWGMRPKGPTYGASMTHK
jgi:hypothetical protein